MVKIRSNLYVTNIRLFMLGLEGTGRYAPLLLALDLRTFKADPCVWMCKFLINIPLIYNNFGDSRHFYGPH
jgi:hypothetical protein